MSTTRKRVPPKVTVNTPIGPDVDLEKEDVRLKSGRRLTQEVVDEFVKASRVGRRSLGGEAGRSPQVAFRITSEQRAAAERAAQQLGLSSVSEFARAALAEKIQNATKPQPTKRAKKAAQPPRASKQRQDQDA